MGKTEYIDSITVSESEEIDCKDYANSADFLYDEAVTMILETQRVSISNIQSLLCVGYNRSARLIEEMEAAGARY